MSPAAAGSSSSMISIPSRAKDGSVIGAGISGTPTGALLTPAVTKFDPRNFSWLGSAGTETFLVVITDRAPVQKLEDLFKRELVIGASASGSASVDFPVVTNAIIGTKFKIVSGYPAANVVVKIAMPAGEVDGCSVYTLSGIRTQHAREYAEGKIRILAQWGMKPDPQIPDVPLMPLGSTKADHQLFELLYARGNYGRPYMLPPGVPPARVAALRARSRPCSRIRRSSPRPTSKNSRWTTSARTRSPGSPSA